MDRVFDQAKDVHVSATYVYGNGSDTYAYEDSGCTKKIGTSALTDLFLKGAVIVVGGVNYKPISLKVARDVATVTFVKADTSTETTAVLATLSSVKDA